MTDLHSTTTLVADLTDRVSGAVLTAGDPGYDEARTLYFGNRVGEPVAVIRPADARDVATVVATAARTGIDLAVRGGGHHAAGYATGNGLQLDLASLGSVVVERDTSPPSVWAGAGLTAGGLTSALGGQGLAVGFGDTGSVGIGGITMGGGIGFLSRRDGMTIDNLLAAEVVTADGQVHVVDADHEPDLFWALRGGAGNVGVATRFRYRLTTLTDIYGGTLLQAATPEAVERVVAAAADAPDELIVIVTVMAMPPMEGVPSELHGRLVIRSRVCFCGDLAAAERAVAPLRAAAEPLADQLDVMPYSELFAETPPSHGETIAAHNQFLDSFGLDDATTLLAQFDRSDAWMRMVQLRAMGGAINRVDADATAFAHRDRDLMVTVACNAIPDLGAARSWVGTVAAELPPSRPGAYVGFFGANDEGRLTEAFPPRTLQRLQAVKTVHDPDNLFHNNVNVAPAR